MTFQAMLLELKTLEKLSECNVVKVDGLMELLEDLMEVDIVK